jgi:hypothetical protein
MMIIPYQQMYTLLSMYSADVVGLDNFWIGGLVRPERCHGQLFQYGISYG